MTTATATAAPAAIVGGIGLVDRVLRSHEGFATGARGRGDATEESVMAAATRPVSADREVA